MEEIGRGWMSARETIKDRRRRAFRVGSAERSAREQRAERLHLLHDAIVLVQRAGNLILRELVGTRTNWTGHGSRRVAVSVWAGNQGYDTIQCLSSKDTFYWTADLNHFSAKMSPNAVFSLFIQCEENQVERRFLYSSAGSFRKDISQSNDQSFLQCH